jgi:hypothetical protein
MAPMTPPEAAPNIVEIFAFLTVAGSAVGALLCVVLVRAQAVRQTSATGPLPRLDPWEWMRISTPLRVIGLAGLLIAFLAARRFAAPLNLIVLVSGLWIGQIVENLARARVMRKGTLLWTDFNTGAILAYGASQLGILFGASTLCIEYLITGVFDVVSWLAGLAGLLAGILYVAALWGIAKINAVRRQGEPAAVEQK